MSLLPEQIQKLWHPTRNLPLVVDDVSTGSGKKVWWLGACGHEWEATVYNFAKKTKNFCPICSGQMVLAGFNDIATTHKNISSQWHPTKNSKTPTEVTAGSSFEVTWLCENQHEWTTPVYHRTKPGTPGCPYCSGRLAVPGENDLATVNPALAEEWHPTKNGDLVSSMVKPMSNQKVWWLAECGHEWETTIANRTSGKNCPYCSGNKTVKTENVPSNPALLKKWSKSNLTNPDNVHINSKKEYFWVCEHGHEFTSSPRIQQTSHYCPVCSNRSLMTGVNDLETKHPDLKKTVVTQKQYSNE